MSVLLQSSLVLTTLAPREIYRPTNAECRSPLSYGVVECGQVRWIDSHRVSRKLAWPNTKWNIQIGGVGDLDLLINSAAQAKVSRQGRVHNFPKDGMSQNPFPFEYIDLKKIELLTHGLRRRRLYIMQYSYIVTYYGSRHSKNTIQWPQCKIGASFPCCSPSGWWARCK